MNNNQSRREFCATAIATIFASATSVRAAEKKYDPGATDTEIKIGQTVPHSGPGSLYGVLGRVGEAYFQMLNESGGINGRQIKFLTMDDAYSASKWNDPKNNKWTMAGLPLYPTEARILAKHVIAVKPDAKIGILYQNDDFGRDFLGPFKKALEDAGGSAKVIMEQTYDLTEPTVDSQLINLSKSGADVFYNITTGKATSQSIRKVVELGWK